MAPYSTIRPTSTASRASYNDRMTLNETALFATQLAMGFALAATVGLRAFLPLFVAGLLARQGYVDLGHSFEWMQGTPALVVFGSALVFEILADKIPAVDHALDAAGVIVKPLAGTLVAAALFPNVDPLPATVLGLVGGGTIAATVHAVKGTTRFFSSVTTAGAGNPLLSMFEDALAGVGILAAILIPVIAAITVLALVALGAWLYRRRRTRSGALPSEGSYPREAPPFTCQARPPTA